MYFLLYARGVSTSQLGFFQLLHVLEYCGSSSSFLSIKRRFLCFVMAYHNELLVVPIWNANECRIYERAQRESG